MTNRRGKKLPEVFNSSKAVFSVVHQNLCASGQNDPSFRSFRRFVPLTSEVDGIRHLMAAEIRDYHIRAEGKRAMTIFVALGCGTPSEDLEKP